jgi:preprotein translocase subunit SecA
MVSQASAGIDDVLNAQRKRIYSQRDKIFTKDDLHEDVSEMLITSLAAGSARS